MPPIRLWMAPNPLFSRNIPTWKLRSVMADDHDILIRVQLAATYRNEMHRHVLRAFQVAQLEFPGFPHVKQQGLGPAFVGQPCCQLRGASLLHQKLKLAGTVAPSSG